MARYRANKNLKERRTGTYTQKEMTALLNIELQKEYTRPWYARIEAGTKTASANAAVAIARLLEVDLEEIFENSETN